MSTEPPPEPIAAPDPPLEPIGATAADTAINPAFEPITPNAPVGKTACPACGEPAPGDASWCEACGADLGAKTSEALPASACISCDAPPQEITQDQYCMRCGAKQPSKRDHLEVDETTMAGVSDRGQRHHRNEDAFSIAAVDDHFVIVVCDGVSSTDNPDQASQAAADTVVELMVPAVTSGADIGNALTDAVAAAHQAVSAVPSIPGGDGPPSCTIVATVGQVIDGMVTVTVAWLGDSRAYWVDDTTVTQLTTDHSWTNEALSTGDYTEQDALTDPRSHSITKWLGADAPDIVPEIRTMRFPVGGRLLACSDGLWNYASSSPEMADLERRYRSTPIETARALTQHANDAGGHDNITVAIAATAASQSGPSPDAPTTAAPPSP